MAASMRRGSDGVNFVGFVGRSGNLFQRQRNGGVPVKRGFPGEHFVEDQPESVDVHAMVESLALGLFGRHIRRRAHHAPGHRGILRVRSRNAEIHHLQAAIRPDHDVLRLQVAMHNGLAMRLGEALRQLPRELDGAPGFQAALALQKAAQALSLHEFHREIDRVARAMEFVQSRHVAMRDLVRQQQFVLEALQNLRIAGDLGLQDLQRHNLAGLTVPHLIDDAHAAAPQFAEHLISRRQSRRLDRSHESGLVFGSRHVEVYTSARIGGFSLKDR